jgi:branched-subunit amino acid ABC-type transport system permease component
VSNGEIASRTLIQSKIKSARERVKASIERPSCIRPLTLDWLLPSIVQSISTGSILVVVSIGLTLTLAVVKLPNFAHAEFLTVGAYVGVLVSHFYPNNLLLIAGSAFLVCALLAIVIHHTIYKPLLNRKVSIYFLVLASFAVAQLVRYGVFALAASVTPNALSTSQQISIYTVASYLNAQISNIYVLSIALAIVVSVLLGLFFGLTHLGKSMRAIANNFDLARISGINVSLAINVMWIIAGGLGGLGGVVLGTYTTVTPVLGFNSLLDIFAVVIIAGLTSFVGTIIGGFLVGFSTNTVIQALNYYFGVSFGYTPLLPFAMIIVVLLFKPTGLAPNSQTGLAFLRKLLKSGTEGIGTKGVQKDSDKKEKI